jgi:cytosine/uracil/thiamine/allantoin permease
VAIILRGIESIRVLEKYSAPVLVALALALLAWALNAAGGVGPMLSAPSQFAAGAVCSCSLGALLTFPYEHQQSSYHNIAVNI